MQRSNRHSILAAWQRAPLMTRLTILARSVAHGERPQVGVGKLIDLVALMASFLDAEHRLMVAQHIKDTADAIAPPFDRRALH